jgi:hypothetical protein
MGGSWRRRCWGRCRGGEGWAVSVKREWGGEEEEFGGGRGVNYRSLRYF